MGLRFSATNPGYSFQTGLCRFESLRLWDSELGEKLWHVDDGALDGAGADFQLVNLGGYANQVEPAFDGLDDAFGLD